MKTLDTREDIDRLVHTFYAKIRRDDLLGPIFNRHIAEDEWPAHLSKLTDFWETNLLGVPSFKGNPTMKHIQVDRSMSHSISQLHFGTWLNLWFQTIEESYTGERATRAKEGARRMAHGQFMQLWKHRPKT